MDSKTSDAEINGGEQQSAFPISLIGDWEMEHNFPYGFIIRNRNQASTGTEYHFWYDSNGWITAKIRDEVSVLTPSGRQGFMPQLCDRQSTKKLERIAELRRKGAHISDEEARELLNLCGLIKSEG